MVRTAAISKGGAWNAPWFAMVLKQAPHVPLRAQKLSNLTTAKITAYQQYWSGLFK